MARGVIYVMTTVVDGLIKIGKTRTDQFENRMYQLERNGYFNVGGLKRKFAIEVDDYDDKEKLLDEIFAKSNVSGSELFALDAELVVQLLSSFEGKQIYPETMTKNEVFTEATEEHRIKSDWGLIPDGLYTLSKAVKGFGQVTASMRVMDGTFIVEKGSICLPTKPGWIPEARRNAPIKNNVLIEDTPAKSPSTAGWIILCSSNNGWDIWKNQLGKPINIYRKK